GVDAHRAGLPVDGGEGVSADPHALDRGLGQPGMLPVNPMDERPVDAVDLGAGEDSLAAPVVEDLRTEARSGRREDDVRQTRGNDAIAVNAAVRRSSASDD